MIPGRAEKKRSQARPCRGSNTGQHDLQSYALPLSYRVRRLLTPPAFPYRDSLLMECTKLRSLKLSFLALQIQACTFWNSIIGFGNSHYFQTTRNLVYSVAPLQSPLAIIPAYTLHNTTNVVLTINSLFDPPIPAYRELLVVDTRRVPESRTKVVTVSQFS